MAFESSVPRWPTPRRLGYRLSAAVARHHGGGIPTHLSRNFGVASASVVEATYVWACNSVGGKSRLGFGVMRGGAGIGPAVIIENVSGSWRLGAGLAGSGPSTAA